MTTPIPKRRRTLVDHVGVHDELVRGRRLVYLDNNIWIDLVDGKTAEARACRDACEAAVIDGRVLFPLGIASVEELLDQPAEAVPTRQADLMDALSKRVCFRAPRHVWFEEARATIDVFPGYGAVVPQRERLFTYVIEYLADAHVTIPESWEREQTDTFTKFIMEQSRSVVGVRWLRDRLPVDEMRARHELGEAQFVARMQTNISEASATLRRGGKLDRKAIVRRERQWAFQTHIVPTVGAEARGRYGIEGTGELLRDAKERFGDGSPERLEKLMLSTPSLDLMCEVMAERTMNPTRPVRREDMLDNEHCFVAPAYCDAFVTADKNMRDLLDRRCAVPRRRNCEILSSLAALRSWLAREQGRG